MKTELTELVQGKDEGEGRGGEETELSELLVWPNETLNVPGM